MASLRLYGPAPDVQAGRKKTRAWRKATFFARFSPDASRIAVGFDDSTKVNVLSGDDLRFLYAPDTSQVDNGNLGQRRLVRRREAALRRRTFQAVRVCSQSLSGRRPAAARQQFWPASTSTIMDLRPLANGRLVFGGQDPAWAVLDTQGKRLVGGDPPDSRSSR